MLLLNKRTQAWCKYLIQNLLELLVGTSVRLVFSWIKLVTDDWFSTSFSDFKDLAVVDDCSENLSVSNWILKSVHVKYLFD